MPLQAITATNQKGELKVDINKNLESTPHSALDCLINKTTTDLQISIAAVGKWRLYNKPSQDPAIAPFYNETDSQGYQNIDDKIFNRYEWLYPFYPAGIMVSKFYAADGSAGAVKLKFPGESDFSSTPSHAMAGAPYTVILPPGYYITFGINDDHRFFPDNIGSLTIQYAVVQSDGNLLPVIYENNNFTGASQVLSIGRYVMANLNVGNDQISSVKVPPGYKVTLFEHGINEGRSKVLYADAANLPDFDNITSALIVEALPMFYENANYTGISQPLDRGQYPDCGQLSLGHDKISSVKVPLGFKVILYRDANFGGPSKVLYTDAATLSDFDNNTSSIIIEALSPSDVSALQGNGFYTTDGNGNISLLKQHTGWRKTWSLIVPGHFGGNSFTDLLFYDRTTGDAEFSTTDGNGNITPLKKHSGWEKTWSQIIPGQFGGSEFTDLFFYDPTKGEAYFFTTDGNGNLSQIKRHTGWRKTWNLMIPGDFGGSSFTDLFFYDPTSGEAEFFTTDGNGNIFTLKKHTGWRKTWSLMIPGNFGGSSFTDLLFYDPTTGEAEFLTTDGNGNIFTLKKHTGWRKTWTLMIPGNFGGNEYTDLLFYDSTTGEAEVLTTDGNGNIFSLKRHTGWRKTWKSMIPGNFSGGTHTSFLFYDPLAD